MTTLKYTYGDYLGMTEGGRYIYTYSLPNGGFGFEISDIILH